MEGNLTTGKQHLYLPSLHWISLFPSSPGSLINRALLTACFSEQEGSRENPAQEHSFEVFKQVKNNLLGQIHKFFFFLMWIFYGTVIQPFTVEVKCFFNTITELLKWMLI